MLCIRDIAYRTCASIMRMCESRYVVVLLYHRILSKSECEESGIASCSVDTFRMQMDYLRSQDVYIASLDEVVEYVRGNIELPQRTVAITFDDGFRDNYHNAYPILKEREIAATVFLNTSFVGKTLHYRDTFWQPGSIKADLPYEFLSWQQIEHMKKGGIQFGAHTHSHINLARVSDEEATEEIEMSRRIILERLGDCANHFSYPYGVCDDRHALLVASLKFDAAWKVSAENIDTRLDVYTLPRRSVSSDMSIERFEIAVSRHYATYLRMRKAIRNAHLRGVILRMRQ